jgi:RNA polymerase sigma factor for flagellar operon FliA
MTSTAASVTSAPTLFPPPSFDDPAAERDRLAREIQPLVRSIADRLRRRYCLSHSTEYLSSLANVGIASVLARYDPSKGSSFTTFAYYRIRGAILDGLRRGNREYAYLRRHLMAMEPANDNSTAPPAPSDANEPPVDRQARLPEALHELASQFEAPDGACSDEAVRWEAEDELDRRRSAARVRRALAELSARERKILELRYDEEKGFREIGKELGLSGPRVYRIHERALESLRGKLIALGMDQAS